MNDDLLIQRLLDGTLTPAEHAAVNQRLRDDAELREHMREIAEQAVAMGDMARQLEADRPSGSLHVAEKRATFTHWLALAASVALLASSAWLWMGRRDAPVLTLVDSSGTVVWNHGGEMRVNVSEGEKLAAGTLETLGEAASAQLQFADGTIISLTGESELSFSEETQKLLVLRKGSLSAQVKPQPLGHPMIVRTPSAEAEIVGTTFNLSARPDDTLLKVDEGLVKLKRLADGSSIDVPAQSSAVASLNSSLKLDPAVTPEPLTRWRFDFTTVVPPQIWRGIWHDTPEGGRMVASPYVAQKTKEGAVVTHFGVSVRTGYLNPPLALVVTAMIFPFFPAEGAYTRMFNDVHEGDVLLPSPLVRNDVPEIVVHFQFEPDGTLTSPQVPHDEWRTLAEARYLTPAQVDAASASLEEVRRTTTREQLLNLLPERKLDLRDPVLPDMVYADESWAAQNKMNQAEYQMRSEAYKQQAVKRKIEQAVRDTEELRNYIAG